MSFLDGVSTLGKKDFLPVPPERSLQGGIKMLLMIGLGVFLVPGLK